MIRQITRTVDAIRAAKEARGELHAAHALTHDARTALTRLENRLNGALSTTLATGAPASTTTGERASERLLREQLERQRAGNGSVGEPVPLTPAANTPRPSPTTLDVIRRVESLIEQGCGSDR